MLEYNQVLLPMKKNRVELRSGFSFTLTNDCLFFWLADHLHVHLQMIKAKHMLRRR